MKAKREHRVPLCGRAIDIIDEARTFGDGSPIVFTIGDGQPIIEKHLRRLLATLEIAAVPHGFRSSFRDWAAEETDHPREVVEAALAHVVRNKVEAAYRRTDLFERRRRLMDDWATYLAGGAATTWRSSQLPHSPQRYPSGLGDAVIQHQRKDCPPIAAAKVVQTATRAAEPSFLIQPNIRASPDYHLDGWVASCRRRYGRT